MVIFFSFFALRSKSVKRGFRLKGTILRTVGEAILSFNLPGQAGKFSSPDHFPLKWVRHCTSTTALIRSGDDDVLVVVTVNAPEAVCQAAQEEDGGGEEAQGGGQHGGGRSI